MIRSNRWLLWGALAVALSVVGCECGGTTTLPGDDDAGSVIGQDGGNPDGGEGNPTTDGGDTWVEPDGGISGNLPDGGTSGLVLMGGPGSVCVVAGAECERTQGASCCTGVCGLDGRCPEPNILCRAAGEPCQKGGECCGNACIAGTCSAALCRDVGGACTQAEQCCTKTCTDGRCAEWEGLSGSCELLGQACSGADACCSKNCQNGVCVRAWSCKANGDLCTRNAECCGSSCSTQDGGLGRCQGLSGGEVCGMDGLPCAGGSGCCSRACVDPGHGATVCYPASGCKTTGNTCTSDAVCCGSIAPSNVMCEEGRCNNGWTCNGTGNPCGEGKLPDGGVLLINASQNCCEGQKAVCKVDSSGVPRCFGGGLIEGCPNGHDRKNPDCCIQTGNRCQFSDQCCSGSLCLPDSSGNLTCQPPASNTDADGGTGSCSGGGCTAPAACQPRQGLCTTSADCCVGLRCEVPLGSTVGSCQSGSTCSSSGQACSPRDGCCSGLSCRDDQGGACDGTSACTCRVVIPQ